MSGHRQKREYPSYWPSVLAPATSSVNSVSRRCVTALIATSRRLARCVAGACAAPHRKSRRQWSALHSTTHWLNDQSRLNASMSVVHRIYLSAGKQARLLVADCATSPTSFRSVPFHAVSARSASEQVRCMHNDFRRDVATCQSICICVNRRVFYCDHAVDLRRLPRGVVFRKMAII